MPLISRQKAAWVASIVFYFTLTSLFNGLAGNIMLDLLKGMPILSALASSCLAQGVKRKLCGAKNIDTGSRAWDFWVNGFMDLASVACGVALMRMRSTHPHNLLSVGHFM